MYVLIKQDLHRENAHAGQISRMMRVEQRLHCIKSEVCKQKICIL